MDSVKLGLQPRTVLGKKVRALRRNGITPVHLYGPGVDSLALQADSTELRNVLVRAGRTTPVSITLDGDSDTALTLIREVAVHPASGEIQHVDFLRVDPDRLVETNLRVTLVGESPALVGGQAEVTQVIRLMPVRALPLNTPDHLEADISGLEHIGAVLRISDLEMPEGVEPTGSPDGVIARVRRVREREVFAEAEVEEELEGVEGEEVEGEEAEAAAEGEAAEADSESGEEASS